MGLAYGERRGGDNTLIYNLTTWQLETDKARITSKESTLFVPTWRIGNLWDCGSKQVVSNCSKEILLYFF